MFLVLAQVFEIVNRGGALISHIDSVLFVPGEYTIFELARCYSW